MECGFWGMCVLGWSCMPSRVNKRRVRASLPGEILMEDQMRTTHVTKNLGVKSRDFTKADFEHGKSYAVTIF